MKTLAAIVALSLLASTGCIVVSNPRGVSRSGVKAASPVCDNNQYWDGTMCRHKGKGHGARKHDG